MIYSRKQLYLSSYFPFALLARDLLKLKNFFIDHKRLPWLKFRETFIRAFVSMSSNLDYFPCIPARIRPLITRFSPQSVFEDCSSAVYIVWSPFSRDFYIGSIQRNGCVFDRFREHMLSALSDPIQKSHLAFSHSLGFWCISVVAMNIPEVHLYENYLIKKLKPSLNFLKPKSNLQQSKPLQPPPSLCPSCAQPTNPASLPFCPFFFSSPWNSHEPISSLNLQFSPNLSTVLSNSTLSRNSHLLMISGSQLMPLSTSLCRFYKHSIVSLFQFSFNPDLTTSKLLLRKCTLQELLKLLPSLPPCQFFEIFFHSISIKHSSKINPLPLTFLAQQSSLSFFKTLSMSSFVSLYKSSSYLSNRLQSLLRHRISRAFKKHFSFSLFPSISFSLQYHPTIRPHDFRSLLYRIIQQHSQLPQTLATHFKNLSPSLLENLLPSLTFFKTTNLLP